MHEDFEKCNNQYYSCSQTKLELGLMKTVNSGLRALGYLGPKI